jgi:hypothetical protein
MAVIEGGTTGALQDVEPIDRAGRVTLRPMDRLGWFCLAARSGALTGAGANTAVFSFRNLSSNQIVVRRVGIGFVCTTGFTAAQELSWGLKVARAFTASDSGGTPIALTGNNVKLRTALATLSSVDCQISSTGALTAGTKTLDTNDLGIISAHAAAATAGNLLPLVSNNLLAHDAGSHPLVLGLNEGINVMNLVAMGAAGVGTLVVFVELAEVLTY